MAGCNYAIDVAGVIKSLHVQVLEMNECAGLWMEAENGVKRPVTEPSGHAVVKVDGNEIMRRTASLGKEFGQEGVVVAVHDSAAKESGVFSLTCSMPLTNSNKEAISQAFTDAGLSGTTALLDKPEFRFLAFDEGDMAIVKKVTKALPRGYGAKLSFQPAEMRYIHASEYDMLIARKAAPKEIVAETFVMGVPKRKQ